MAVAVEKLQNVIVTAQMIKKKNGYYYQVPLQTPKFSNSNSYYLYK